MNTDWISSINGVVSAVIGGAIASILAPFVVWQLEKRKIRLESRRQLVSEARQFLRCGREKNEIIESELYSRLRPHLRPDLTKAIESEVIVVKNGGRGAGVNQYSSKLLDEVVRLEKHWGLI